MVSPANSVFRYRELVLSNIAAPWLLSRPTPVSVKLSMRGGGTPIFVRTIVGLRVWSKMLRSVIRRKYRESSLGAASLDATAVAITAFVAGGLVAGVFSGAALVEGTV